MQSILDKAREGFQKIRYKKHKENSILQHAVVTYKTIADARKLVEHWDHTFNGVSLLVNYSRNQVESGIRGSIPFRNLEFGVWLDEQVYQRRHSFGDEGDLEFAARSCTWAVSPSMEISANYKSILTSYWVEQDDIVIIYMEWKRPPQIKKVSPDGEFSDRMADSYFGLGYAPVLRTTISRSAYNANERLINKLIKAKYLPEKPSTIIERNDRDDRLPNSSPYDDPSPNFAFEFHLRHLRSQGVIIDDQFPQLREIAMDVSYDKMETIMFMMEHQNKRIFDVMNYFPDTSRSGNFINPYKPHAHIPHHCILIRKIMITPLKEHYILPSVEKSNRVLRHWKGVNFPEISQI